MIAIADTSLLPDHPLALAIGQGIMALVAVLSFYWAYKITKPTIGVRDLRQIKVEAVVGLKLVCNPGRRESDRCTTCPQNELCLKSLNQPDPEVDEVIESGSD